MQNHHLVEFGSALRQEFQTWSDRLLQDWLTPCDLPPELETSEAALSTTLPELEQDCVDLYRWLTAGFSTDHESSVPAPTNASVGVSAASGQPMAAGFPAQALHDSQPWIGEATNSQTQPLRKFQSASRDASSDSMREGDRQHQPQVLLPLRQGQHSSSASSISSSSTQISPPKVRYSLKTFPQSFHYQEIHHPDRDRRDSSRKAPAHQKQTQLSYLNHSEERKARTQDRQTTTQSTAIASHAKSLHPLIASAEVLGEIVIPQASSRENKAHEIYQLPVVPLSSSEKFITTTSTTRSTTASNKLSTPETIEASAKGLKEFASQLTQQVIHSPDWMIDKPLGELDDFDRTQQRQVLQPISDRTLRSPQLPKVQHPNLQTPLTDAVTEHISPKLPPVPPDFNHEHRSEESLSSSSPPRQSDFSTQADIPRIIVQSEDSANLTSTPPAASFDTLLEALEVEINRDYRRHYGS